MKLNIESLEKDEAAYEITCKLGLHSILPLVQALTGEPDGTQIYPEVYDLMEKNYSKRTLQNIWKGAIMREACTIQYLHSLGVGVNWQSDEKSRLRAERIIDSIQYIY